MTCVQDQQFNNVLCALTLRARPPCVILTPESSKRSIKIVGLDVFISLCCLYVSVCIEVLVLSVMSCLLSGVFMYMWLISVCSTLCLKSICVQNT